MSSSKKVSISDDAAVANNMRMSSPLLSSHEHHVVAEVMEVDRPRICGGMAVETDYIICGSIPAACKSKKVRKQQQQMPLKAEQKLNSTTNHRRPFPPSLQYASSSIHQVHPTKNSTPSTHFQDLFRLRTLAHQTQKSSGGPRHQLASSSS
jgi:hypothetical protein